MITAGGYTRSPFLNRKKPSQEKSHPKDNGYRMVNARKPRYPILSRMTYDAGPIDVSSGSNKSTAPARNTMIGF
jgi:hypothetical protein